MHPDKSFPTAIPGLNLLHASLSDIGCRRQKNEDAAGFFPPADPSGTYLLVVADGVGGNVAGEVASRIAVETIGRAFFAGGEPADLRAAMYEAIGAANHAILDDALSNPLRASMATTCTAAAIRGQELVLGHVGDCRAYLVQGGQIFHLTDDHSLAADYRRRGEPLPPDKAGLANVLTRWLGSDSEVQPDISEPLSLAEGSTLILCSDGLTKMVGDDEILYIASMHLPEAACRRLVDKARAAGGPDNITVQVARLSRV
jgi:protein phosphatase